MEAQTAPPKIGTLVAANSGRPGGSVGWGQDETYGVCPQALHASHHTQEEDIVANWLLTHAFNRGVKESQDALMSEVGAAFDCIRCAWGLAERGVGLGTLQEVNYCDVVDAQEYADVWSVSNVWLSAKAAGCIDPSSQKWFDHSKQFETSLYFTAAPNASDPKTDAQGRQGSMARTSNVLARDSRKFFMDGIRWSLRTSLWAMAADGVRIVLLPLIGGGVYCGAHRHGYFADFCDLVNAVLVETFDASTASLGSGTPLMHYFDKVVLVTLTNEDTCE